MPTVLFVDDEPAILDGLRRALWREPYVVITADSAARGLEILATTRVDVVVSDERMPVMSGSEFLGRVRDAYPGVVRIMLTGEAALPDAVNQGSLDRFLHKPMSPTELTRTIQQAIFSKLLMDQRAALFGGDPAVPPRE